MYGTPAQCGILQITCSESPLPVSMESIGTQHASRQQTTRPEYKLQQLHRSCNVALKCSSKCWEKGKKKKIVT